MPWRCGWKSKLAQACTPPPIKTLTVLILPSTLSTAPTRVVLACTWMYMDWQGVILLQALLLAHRWEGHLSATADPLMMMGYPLIPPSQIGPFAGGVGAEEVEVARAVVTPMELAPLEEGERKRMDFLVRSKSPNLGARRVILMTWLMPSGSGLIASLTIMIIMRILISCPW